MCVCVCLAPSHHTKGKKKSKGSLALMVGLALRPGRAAAETEWKLTELLTDRTLLPALRVACRGRHTGPLVGSASGGSVSLRLKSHQPGRVGSDHFSDADDLSLRVHQGSVLGPFN